MKEIKFQYRDSLSQGKWKEQSCICNSVKECKEFYGLGIDKDCEYKILSVEEV